MQAFLRGRVPARVALVVVLVVFGLLALAAPAMAGPAEPTLSLADLQTKLEAGPLTGYLKTVVSGYTIEQIPVSIEATTEWSNGTLLVGVASGPVIDKIGNVAAGMSGSPVYVNDGGVDKLVGALSYGADFTRGGMFLATPVEYMSAIEADYAVGPPAGAALKLSAPIRTDAGMIRSVVVSPEQAVGGTVETQVGQAVMRPLTVLAIGGLSAQSRAFKELAAKLEKQTGLTAQAASSGGFWTGLPAPALQGGSSVCQLFSLGSVWYGAMGTATYVNNGVVMAFGHSSWWTGSCGAAMAAGYVSGIWPSDWASFKMIDPRDIKGTIVQDRTWGIAGVVGEDPEMIPVTSHVTFPETGREVTNDSAAVEWAFKTTGYEDLPAYPVMQALWDACDAYATAGSAETVTTVKVSDETGSYTVRLENLFDSYDITWEPFFDVDSAVYSLGQDPDGVLDVHLDSIDFQATISSARRSARLVGLALPSGLHTGDNPVTITYYRYGSRDLQTLTGNLSIPAGTPVNGAFDLMPAWYGGDSWDEGDYYETNIDPPATLAELVDQLNSSPRNSDLILTFQPRNDDSPGGAEPPSGAQSSDETDPYAPIEVTFPTDWVFDGEIYAETWRVVAYAHPHRLAYGGTTRFAGTVQGATGDLSVAIYKRSAGSATETYVKTVPAVAEDGMAFFTTRISGLKKNTTLIARVAGSDGWLPGSDSAKVRVAAKVRVGVTVDHGMALLTAHLLPADTVGLVGFQIYKGGRWQWYGMPKAVQEGAARMVMPVKAGNYKVRAKFLGGDLNTPATSPAVTFTVV